MVADPNLKVMAIGPDNYPLDITTLRELIGGLRPGSGPLDPGHFRLSPAPPEAGLAVEISPGKALLEGPNPGQGSYFVHSSAPKLFPWPVPPDSLPRVDTLVAVVRDSQYGAISGPLGPDWIVVPGVPGSSPVAVSDAEISAQLDPGDLWLAAHNVRVTPGAAAFVAGDLTRRFQPLTTARTGSELLVSTADNPAFRSWSLQSLGSWRDFPAEYFPPVEVFVPSSGRIRCTITGRTGNGAVLPSQRTVRMRYRLTGANEVSGEALTLWSFVGRGTVNSFDSSSCAKTLRDLNSGWTTVIPQLYVTPGTVANEFGIAGGDLDVLPVF